MPSASRAAVPKLVDPFRKVTVPVGDLYLIES